MTSTNQICVFSASCHQTASCWARWRAEMLLQTNTWAHDQQTFITFSKRTGRKRPVYCSEAFCLVKDFLAVLNLITSLPRSPSALAPHTLIIVCKQMKYISFHSEWKSIIRIENTDLILFIYFNSLFILFHLLDFLSILGVISSFFAP